MEQAIRTVLTAAVHKVKSKTYDVAPADPVQTFLDDLFAELFPSSSVEQTVTIPTVTESVPEPEPVKERKKPGPKPKAKAKEGPVHIDKLTPGEVKKLKAVVPEFDKKPFLAYVNGLSKEDFDSKNLEDHLRAFSVPAPAPAEPEKLVPKECIEVLFQDSIYYVDPETKRVYEPRDEVNVAVGYVGIAAFKDMPMPDDDQS